MDEKDKNINSKSDNLVDIEASSSNQADMVDIESGKLVKESSQNTTQGNYRGGNHYSQKPTNSNNNENKDENKVHYKKPDKKENFFIKHKAGVIITSVSVVLLCAIGVVLFQVIGSNQEIQNIFIQETTNPIENDNGEFIFLPDTYVSGIDISGQTVSSAKAVVEKSQSNYAPKISLKVLAKDNTYDFTERDFTFTYNVDDVLNEAKKYCEDVVDGTIKPTENKTNDEDGSESTQPEMFKVKATLDTSSVADVVQKVGDGTDYSAKNARVSKFNAFASGSNKFEFVDGSSGYQIDRDDLSKSITEFLQKGNTNGTINANGKEIAPKITREMVEANIVGLSSFTTTSVNTAAATSNMGTALEACNNSVIEPGETWSFNSCTGNSNLESNGYKTAGVISDGKYVEGVGGGLCQASTTIYNAALFANMEIAERHNHFWASTYVPAGLDATIDYPGLDLQLKNVTDYQMFIECKLEGMQLICNIYGYQDPSYDKIETTSENYNIVSGESYDTCAYRILYKNDAVVSKEELTSSHYSLTEGHYVQTADSGTYGKKPTEY